MAYNLINNMHMLILILDMNELKISSITKENNNKKEEYNNN